MREWMSFKLPCTLPVLREPFVRGIGTPVRRTSKFVDCQPVPTPRRRPSYPYSSSEQNTGAVEALATAETFSANLCEP